MSLSRTRLVVADETWAKLQKDIWSDDYVDACWMHGSVSEAVGLRFRGGHTRAYAKKSFEIKRRDGTLHFNAESDDPSLIRNALSFQFFQCIGVPSPNTRHTVLSLNGDELGVYLAIEGVDAKFFRRRYIPVRSLLYAGNNDANFSLISPDTKKLKRSLFDGYELVIGDRVAQQRMEDFIFDVNTVDDSEFIQYLENNLDVENYLRWIAGAVCTGNCDGFDQNYAIYEHNGLAIYRIVPWDYEGTWGRNCYGEQIDSDTVRATGDNALTQKLLSYPSFRRRYASILRHVLATCFTDELLLPQIRRMMEQVRADIGIEKARYNSLSEFDAERAIFESYIGERRAYLLRELVDLA